MTPCRVVIFSHPSRAEERQKTIARFESRTDRVLPFGYHWVEPVFWTGPHLGRLPGENQDTADFRALLNWRGLNNHDLLFLEDDIDPVRNAIPYMVNHRNSFQRLTSFYNPYRKVGLNHGFIFSQAFKLPWRLIDAMRREEWPPPHPKLQRDGIDQVVNRFLVRWNMPFWQHRSLVQHVGEVSTWTKSTLKGNGRTSIDWPGPDVDALTFKW